MQDGRIEQRGAGGEGGGGREVMKSVPSDMQLGLVEGQTSPCPVVSQGRTAVGGAAQGRIMTSWGPGQDNKEGRPESMGVWNGLQKDFRTDVAHYVVGGSGGLSPEKF